MMRRAGTVVLRLGVIVLAISAVTLAVIWNVLLAQRPPLPSKEALWTINREPAVEFVDAKGITIAVRGPRYGRAVTSAQLPPHVVNAFIAAEDSRFREHSGIDLKAILRALSENTRSGRTVQGGSTITQQLAKNLFLDQDQTIRRKANEARIAFDLERLLSKEEILDLYLNRIYFGDGAYGLDAASHGYFDKAPTDLTLAEAAMLAAFPKAPSRFASQIGETGLRDRQHYVLDRMVDGGFARPVDVTSAKSQHLEFVGVASKTVPGHALDYAMAQVRELIRDPPPDLVIKLTLDLTLQKTTQEAVKTGLASARGKPEAAAILVENNGAIRAMVGGRDFSESQFNRATQAQRQSGSSFKMFVYAAALETGLTPWSKRNDEPMKVGTWLPDNYRENYLGEVTLTTALAQSLNSVAAQLVTEIGPKTVAALAKRFGVTSPLHSYPSIALGADEVTLLDMTAGYGVLARNGIKMSPYIIEEIRNSKGDVLYWKPEADAPRVYAQNLSEHMTGMLNRVVTNGTGRNAQVLGWEVAGKTGTSQGWRDAWFIGYTTRYVAGVWLGNDDDTPMAEITGGGAPARIFGLLMTAALKGIAPEHLPGVEPEQFGEDEQSEADEDLAAPDPSLADAAIGVEIPTPEDVDLLIREP